MGWALYKLEKYDDAKIYLQKAVQLMPSDPIVNDHFADVLWMNGKKLQARYYWEYVLSLEETKEDLKNKINDKIINGPISQLMRIRSYSKINLSLRVLKKLKSGIHDIETSAVLLRLFDELIIEKSKKDLTIFKGKFKKKN